jgi:hypothetical protein
LPTGQSIIRIRGAFRDGRTILLPAVALLAAACSDDAAAPPQPVLVVAAGDAQHALVGSVLPVEIAVDLRDGRQRPLAGVRVTWSASPGLSDVVTPEEPKTDEHGRARAQWQLDGTPGDHVLMVTSEDGATAHVGAYAYDRPPAVVHAMPIITYDGSGQAVHPDFVRLPAPWTGDPLRLVATPYPGGDATFENPSLFTGSSGTAWTVPPGVTNPLAKPAGSYLSDPDVVYDPDAGEMRVYYRRVTTQNEIWMIRSADGVKWSAPMRIEHALNHLIVSPSIVRRGAGSWLMWAVNAGTSGCTGQSTTVELRRSTDGLSWSSPETVTLSDPDGFAWHIDVEWMPSLNEYWAAYPVKRAGSCTTDRLRLATSADGLHWQSYPSPVLLAGASPELDNIVYRSSFDYDVSSGTVTFWYSGAKSNNGVYAWHLAWEQMTETALFARLNQQPPAALRVPQPAQTNIPQLTNETAP